MEKLRVGIIGCGMITKVRHAPEYNENENVELVAFFDQDRSRAEKFAEQYDAKCCDSVEEMLAMDIDAVSICAANKFHAELTIKALNAGKHVLCEKPMAITLQECEDMVAAAEKNNKILMIGHNQRFAVAHQKARELVEAGEIGEVLSFETKFGHGGPEVWTGTPNTWFFDKKLAAFGSMADLGIHKTDLIHYITGQTVTEVTAIMNTLDKKWPDGRLIDVDDNAFCLYRMESGATGFMHVSWTFYGNEKNSIVIYGTKGVIRCYDDEKYSLILEKKDGEDIHFELEQIIKNSDQTLGNRNNTGVIDEFVDSILKNREPLSSGKEALKAMRVIFAAMESAETQKTVQVHHD